MLRFTWSTQISVVLSQVLHPGNLFYIVVNLTTGREIVSADNLAGEVNLQMYFFYLYDYLCFTLQYGNWSQFGLSQANGNFGTNSAWVKMLLLQGLKFAYENFTWIFHYLFFTLEIKQSWVLLVSTEEPLSSFIFHP